MRSSLTCWPFNNHNSMLWLSSWPSGTSYLWAHRFVPKKVDKAVSFALCCWDDSVVVLGSLLSGGREVAPLSTGAPGTAGTAGVPYCVSHSCCYCNKMPDRKQLSRRKGSDSRLPGTQSITVGTAQCQDHEVAVLPMPWTTCCLTLPTLGGWR